VPTVGVSELRPAFWGIVLALPVDELVGIPLSGGIAPHVARSPEVGDEGTLAVLVGSGVSVVASVVVVSSQARRHRRRAAAPRPSRSRSSAARPS